MSRLWALVRGGAGSVGSVHFAGFRVSREEFVLEPLVSGEGSPRPPYRGCYSSRPDGLSCADFLFSDWPFGVARRSRPGLAGTALQCPSIALAGVSCRLASCRSLKRGVYDR